MGTEIFTRKFRHLSSIKFHLTQGYFEEKSGKSELLIICQIVMRILTIKFRHLSLFAAKKIMFRVFGYSFINVCYRFFSAWWFL